MFAAHRLEFDARETFPVQGTAHGCMATVIITVGQRTGCEIAGAIILNTDLVASSEGQAAQPQPRGTQSGHRLFRNHAAHRAGRQIEQALESTLAEGLDGREKHGSRLADPGGSFNEEPAAADEGSVDGHRDLTLAGPVAGKGKMK